MIILFYALCWLLVLDVIGECHLIFFVLISGGVAIVWNHRDDVIRSHFVSVWSVTSDKAESLILCSILCGNNLRLSGKTNGYYMYSKAINQYRGVQM
jgi:hypothetical protein